MTLGMGFDSAYPPTPDQCKLAKQIAGPVPTWWGFYLPGVPNTDPLNTWTPAQMNVLVNAGFHPVPIIVPKSPHPADPVVTATTAYNAAKAFGLNPVDAVCYNGEHINAKGPVWLPIWGAAPTTIGPQSAIQYGGTTVGGLSVDVSKSAPDFPAKTALVCDLEHNVQYSDAWYAAFQQTVATLAKKVDPPNMAEIPLPAGAYPIKDVSSTTDGKGRWDVWMLGNDGHVYQAWYESAKWNGPTVIS